MRLCLLAASCPESLRVLFRFPFPLPCAGAGQASASGCREGSGEARTVPCEQPGSSGSTANPPFQHVFFISICQRQSKELIFPSLKSKGRDGLKV